VEMCDVLFASRRLLDMHLLWTICSPFQYFISGEKTKNTLNVFAIYDCMYIIFVLHCACMIPFAVLH